MGLETGTYINDLNVANPASNDLEEQGDDHLRLIKSVLKTTFPNASKAFRFPVYSAKTGNYTVLATDINAVLACATAGGAFTITLPTTLGAAADGFQVLIVKIDGNANALTVAPSSGTIAGEASLNLFNKYEALLCIWTGSTWIAVKFFIGCPPIAVTGDLTVTEAHLDRLLLVTPASANATLTLPAAASYRGRTVSVKLLSATYDCILDGNASETIDGTATYTLATRYESVTLVSDGTNWAIKDRYSGVGGEYAVLSVANTFSAQQTFSKSPVYARQTLTDAANIDWDMSLARDAQVTLGGNRTLNAPTGEGSTNEGKLFVIQDGTGSRTLTWNAAYVFPNSQDEKPCPDANSVTCYSYYVRGANDIVVKKQWVSARDSIGFYKEYDLGAVNTNSNTNTAHGLGRYPAAVQGYIQCTTTDLGWAVGDRISISSPAVNPTGDGGLVLWFSASVVGYVCGEALYLHGKSAFTVTLATATRWKVMVRVYE